MERLVSVVLPIYNVEKYLDRSMESVVNQTYSNLEIIMVDDGSPDSCPQRCEEWAKKDGRVKVVHKVNAGLGMARNTGIDHATGDYICFFDSDDYVALDTIENALTLAERDHSDLVLFGLNRVDAKGEIRSICYPSTEKDCYEGMEILDFVLPNVIEGSTKSGQGFNLNMSAWGCMFSMALIRGSQWRFASEREYISEDYYSLLELYQYVHKVSILKQACYYYCHNGTSLSRSFRPDRYERICHCYNAMMQVAKKCGYSDVVTAGLSAQYFGSVIGAMKMIVMAEKLSPPDKIIRLKEIINDKTFMAALGKLDFAAENRGRKILIYAAKLRSAQMVYWLVKAKAQSEVQQ